MSRWFVVSLAAVLLVAALGLPGLAASGRADASVPPRERDAALLSARDILWGNPVERVLTLHVAVIDVALVAPFLSTTT